MIDSSYLCFERGMVGDSWLVDIEMAGELNEMSMLLDFSRVKKLIKSIIDEEVDHRLLVPSQHPHIQISTPIEGECCVDLLKPGASIHLRCPNQGVALLPCSHIDTQAISAYLLTRLSLRLPPNVRDLHITLRNENLTGAFYHYSHGLKKHDGNCQRIAHGHRSPIEIYLDDERSPCHEAHWAQRWQDIYLSSQEDCVPLAALALSPTSQDFINDGHLGVKYHAPQGLFQLAIPAARCEIISTDTTVELLAQFIAGCIKQEVGQRAVKVVAYEGVGKGAIAYA